VAGRTEEVVVGAEGGSSKPDWQKPLPAMLGVWTAKASLQAAMIIWLCGFVAIVIDIGTGKFCFTGVVIAINIVAIVISRIWAGMYYDTYRYALTDSEIVVEAGVLFFKKTIIPLRRIQNVNVVQGPIMRAYGVKSVLIETAGGVVYQQNASGMNLAEGQIPAPEDADAMADEIMRRVRALRIGGDV